ncbi:MAG: prolipoprotein diacylglyceryl transferase [Ruminococcaceae bacterium]|nr:prolipoprotein diacylglyceryl transferase [Oscillospiraceae bacterium]
MYSKDIFLGMDLYAILLCAGVFICILVYSKLADKALISFKLQKFCFLCAIFAIPLGYGAAVLFQALYNIKDAGGFEISSNTGATFYGGLIGGAAVFLLIYFTVGHFLFSDGYHARNFFKVADCATASIAIAHCLGRVGCLMAGCCHGARTDAWYGIYMNGEKYVPIQLFEAIFLLCLFVYFTVSVLKKRSCNLPIYMISYGAWRFFIEYARADERGDTIVSFLSPSQFIAVLMVLGGVALLIFEIKYEKAHAQKTEHDAEQISNKQIANNCDGEQ